MRVFDLPLDGRGSYTVGDMDDDSPTSLGIGSGPSVKIGSAEDIAMKQQMADDYIWIGNIEDPSVFTGIPRP